MVDAAPNSIWKGGRRRSLIFKKISTLPDDFLSNYTFVDKPGYISKRCHLPAVPLRCAKAFRLKRKRLISSEVAEIVDFKDVISTSARFQATSEHIVPAIKPLVSEIDVASAIRNLEDNKTNKLPQRYAEKEVDYFKSLRGFGITDTGSKINDASDDLDEKNELWPSDCYNQTSLKKRNTLSGGRLFQDVSCRDASGTAGEHRSLLLSNCIKQYRPSTRGDCLSWSDDYDTAYSSSSSSSSSSYSSSSCEPFRPVPSIFRETVRNKLYLLQSHILPATDGDCSVGGGNDDNDAHEVWTVNPSKCTNRDSSSRNNKNRSDNNYNDVTMKKNSDSTSHSDPLTPFNIAARKIIIPTPSTCTSSTRNPKSGTISDSKRGDLSSPAPSPSCPTDVAKLISEQYDVKVRPSFFLPLFAFFFFPSAIV